MNLANIVLDTSNEQKLSSYISEIFDKPVTMLNEHPAINMGQVNVIFRHVTDQDQEKDAKHTQLEFYVDTLDDLENLLKKVQFYHYRLNSSKNSSYVFEIPEIHGDQKIHYFEIDDTDKRKWKFTTLIQ